MMALTQPRVPRVHIEELRNGFSNRRTVAVGDLGFIMEWTARSGLWHAYRWVHRRHARLIDCLGAGLPYDTAIARVQGG